MKTYHRHKWKQTKLGPLCRCGEDRFLLKNMLKLNKWMREQKKK